MRRARRWSPGVRAALGMLVLLVLAAAVTPAPTRPDTSLPIRVDNPKRLGAWQLPAERIAVGPGYKPSLALLPSGELVMVALYHDSMPGKKIREWTGFWRSGDHGQSW